MLFSPHRKKAMDALLPRVELSPARLTTDEAMVGKAVDRSTAAGPSELSSSRPLASGISQEGDGPTASPPRMTDEPPATTLPVPPPRRSSQPEVGTPVPPPRRKKRQKKLEQRPVEEELAVSPSDLPGGRERSSSYDLKAAQAEFNMRRQVAAKSRICAEKSMSRSHSCPVWAWLY